MPLYRGICTMCALFQIREDAGSSYCEAFPDGIPEDIKAGRVDHRSPVDGDGGEYPPLHYALFSSWDLSVAEHLLERGADPNKLDAWGRTPAMTVVRVRYFIGKQTTEQLRESFAAQALAPLGLLRSYGADYEYSRETVARADRLGAGCLKKACATRMSHFRAAKRLLGSRIFPVLIVGRRLMVRLLTWAFVAFYLFTGLYVAVLPHDFYLTAPGARETGPYNMHFVRDVGFAFITSSVAMGYGIFANAKPVMVFGSLWLLIHGLFHLTLWVLHGMQLDRAAMVDAVVVSIPAIAVFALCLRYRVSS